jgi:hypothetical protein
MTDDSTSTDPVFPPPSPAFPPQSPDDEPLEADTAGGANLRNAAAADAAAAAAAVSAWWSKLDETWRLVAGGSIAAIVITVLGIPFGTWDSADFILLVLVATIFSAGTVWAGTSRRRQTMPIPLPVVELCAGSVAAVLAVWNLIGVLANSDNGFRGGIFGVILAIGLAVAAVAILLGALRHGGGARPLLSSGELSTRLALIGLALVLIGWTLNLTIGYWTMAAATLTLASLTLAAVIVILSRQIASPIPAAWIGVVLGVFAAWLAIGLWSTLADLGNRTVDLGISDILAFLIYVVGLALIVVGGVLTALDQGTSHAPTATEPPPPPPDQVVGPIG